MRWAKKLLKMSFKHKVKFFYMFITQMKANFQIISFNLYRIFLNFVSLVFLKKNIHNRSWKEKNNNKEVSKNIVNLTKRCRSCLFWSFTKIKNIFKLNIKFNIKKCVSFINFQCSSIDWDISRLINSSNYYHHSIFNFFI